MDFFFFFCLFLLFKKARTHFRLDFKSKLLSSLQIDSITMTFRCGNLFQRFPFWNRNLLVTMACKSRVYLEGSWCLQLKIHFFPILSSVFGEVGFTFI